MKILNLQAQTAESVIASFFTSIGGEENWMNMQSFTAEGKINYDGFNYYKGFWNPIKIYKKLGKSRCEIGDRFIRGFDNRSFWKVTDGKLANDREPEVNLLSAPFVEDLLEYKKRGYTLTLIGKQRINWTYWRKCFHIQLTGTDSVGGSTTKNYFFDEGNFRLRMISKPSEQGIYTTVFSKYRRFSAFGYPVVSRLQIDGRTMQLLKIKKISFDTAVPDELFIRPNVSSWKL